MKFLAPNAGIMTVLLKFLLDFCIIYNVTANSKILTKIDTTITYQRFSHAVSLFIERHMLPLSCPTTILLLDRGRHHHVPDIKDGGQ